MQAIATLLIIGFFAIYTPARILLDRIRIDVERYELGDADRPTFRIAFVADLQLDRYTDEARAAEVVGLVGAENPDLILFGGDWITTGPDYIEAAGTVAATFKSRLGMFSVRGDHEHFAYRDRQRSVRELEDSLKAAGVPMIHNQVRRFRHEGKTIAVAFLSNNYIQKSSIKVVDELLAELATADYSILMTHQFGTELAERVRDQVDLVLAAHTHGGQVNPVVGVTHVSIARVETPYVKGRYSLSPRTTVIVTSGIGYSIAPLRYASPASIEIIDLHL